MTAPAKAPSNVPAAARRQVKEANRLIAELNSKPGEIPDGVRATADAPPENSDPSNIPVVNIDPNAAPAAPAATAQPVGSEPDDFEHKYKVLQGKYNREVTDLRARADAQEALLTRVMAEQSRMPAPVAPPPAPVKPEDRFKALGVTEKELADYGNELVDLVDRVSTNATMAEIRQLRQDIQALKANAATVGTVVAETAQQKVFDALFRDVGQQWVQINTSDEFLAWLADVDVFSGTSKLVGLQNAFKNNDAARVVAIFRAYVDGKTPAGSTSQGPAVSRETLIAPGAARGSTGEAPGATGGKIWSEADIRDFYQRARKGKIPADEYAATEAEINRAMGENRIRVDRSSQHHLNNG